MHRMSARKASFHERSHEDLAPDRSRREPLPLRRPRDPEPPAAAISSCPLCVEVGSMRRAVLAGASAPLRAGIAPERSPPGRRRIQRLRDDLPRGEHLLERVRHVRHRKRAFRIALLAGSGCAAASGARSACRARRLPARAFCALPPAASSALAARMISFADRTGVGVPHAPRTRLEPVGLRVARGCGLVLRRLRLQRLACAARAAGSQPPRTPWWLG